MKHLSDKQKVESLRQAEDLALLLDDCIVNGEVDDDEVREIRLQARQLTDDLIDDAQAIQDSRVYVAYELAALDAWVRGEKISARSLIVDAERVKGDHRLMTASGRELLESIKQGKDKALKIKGWLAFQHFQFAMVAVALSLFSMGGLLTLLYIANSDGNEFESLLFTAVSIALTVLAFMYLYCANRFRNRARSLGVTFCALLMLIMLALAGSLLTVEESVDEASLVSGLITICMFVAVDAGLSLIYFVRSKRVREAFIR